MRLWIAILSIVTPCSAAAQTDWTGTRLPGHKPGDVTSAGDAAGVPIDQKQDDAVRTARRMAACVVSRKPDVASSYALSSPGRSEQVPFKAIGGLLPSCMNQVGSTVRVGEMRLNSSMLKGLFSEALLLRGRPAMIDPLAAKSDYAVAWSDEDSGQKIVDEMAVCLAERNPIEAASLIWSQPSSADETRAFAALQGFMGACLAANATLKTNRVGIRLAVAQAYLHRVSDPVSSGATK